jgi:hypothetical protein
MSDASPSWERWTKKNKSVKATPRNTKSGASPSWESLKNKNKSVKATPSYEDEDVDEATVSERTCSLFSLSP